MPPWNYAVPGMQRAMELKALKAQAEENPVDAPKVDEPKADEPTEAPEEQAGHKKEETLEGMLEEVIELPPLSPSPEREPAKEKKQLGLGGTLADPGKETRKQFLERARKKLKCPLAKVIEKAKAVEGLWELWADDDEEETPPPAAKAKAKGKAKAKAKPQAAPEAAPEGPPRKRGRPGGNVDLKGTILNGGEIQDVEEYQKVQVLIKNEMKQQLRMLKASKADEATAAGDNIKTLQAAADRWADANDVERTRRVEEEQRNNMMKIRAGVQLINEGSLKNSELLTEELRQSRRAQGS